MKSVASTIAAAILFAFGSAHAVNVVESAASSPKAEARAYVNPAMTILPPVAVRHAKPAASAASK